MSLSSSTLPNPYPQRQTHTTSPVSVTYLQIQVDLSSQQQSEDINLLWPRVPAGIFEKPRDSLLSAQVLGTTPGRVARCPSTCLTKQAKGAGPTWQLKKSLPQGTGTPPHSRLLWGWGGCCAKRAGPASPSPQSRATRTNSTHGCKEGATAGLEPSRQGKASTQRQSSRELDAEMER